MNFSFSPLPARDHPGGENLHSFLIVERDQLLHEDANIWWSTRPQADFQAGDGPAIFSGGRSLTRRVDKNADHVFYFNEEPRVKTRIAAKIDPRAQIARPRGDL